MIEAVVALVPILRINDCIQRFPLSEIPLLLLLVNLAVDGHLTFFRLFERGPKPITHIIQLAEEVWM